MEGNHMNSDNIKQIFLKEVKVIGQDRTRLFFLIAFPILFMIMFMLIFGGSSTTKFTIGVVNLDEQATTANSWSNRFVGNLTASDLLNVEKYTTNDSAQADLQQGKVSGIVIIPENFSTDCNSLWNSYSSSMWVNSTIPLYADAASTFAKQALGPLVQSVLINTLFGPKKRIRHRFQ